MSTPKLAGSHKKHAPSATVKHFGENLSWKDFDFLEKIGEGCGLFFFKLVQPARVSQTFFSFIAFFVLLALLYKYFIYFITFYNHLSGFGTVTKAYHRATKTFVALKSV